MMKRAKNNMWALPSDRKLLLDIFSRQSPPPHLTGFIDPKRDHIHLSDELLLLWASEPKPVPAPQSGEYLPDAIVVHSKQMREFIAWITTVAGGYRPFTAFIRIIDQQYLQHAIEPKEPGLRGFENAVAGLIIAEALTLAGPQRSLAALSLLPCESTYSYSFARALALGYARDVDDPIAAPFGLARKLTRQPSRRLNEEVLSITLKVLSGLARDTKIPDRSEIPAFIWETCRELQSERELTRSWRLLADAGVLPHQPLGELRGPREQRVRAFERILKGPNRPDVLTSSFLAGLLADQISPGSFEHIDLLLPYLNQYPTAMIWYGLCAGLHPDSEVQQAGNCLGRRLVRDLLASDPVLSRPKYDIAVSELEVHLDREEPLEFRTASQNHIAVELLPGVPALMKWPITQATETVSTPYKGAGSGARQVELPLNTPYTEPTAGLLSADRHYAIQDLERAVERVKRILTEPSPSPSAPDKGDYKRRGKKH
jgi:hypothetical protein